MRAAFTATLAELADGDDRILLLTGDLGYKAIEPFSERHPDRFFNVGVAEQNMMGLATGLAEAGYRPFCYSIATFASLRAYELLRNGPVFHRLPVRVVGVGGGFDYGSAGPSHHALEDVGALRLLPGLTVLAPADPEQTRTMLRATWDLSGPVYYRLGKDDRLEVPALAGRFALGRTEMLREGKDVLFLVTGSLAEETLAAAEELASFGVEASVGIVATLAPPPREELAPLLSRFSLVATVEAHYVDGGLGSIVAETLAERALPCRLLRLGVAEGPDGRSGSARWLLARHGLDRESLVRRTRRALSETDLPRA